jgi:hypothetical protein
MPDGRLLEIACDESGSEGEKLVGGCTDVFAHASVRLDTESAASCIQETRARIRSPAREYKAGHLLRSKHRPVLTWLLGPSGPILGNAHVHLTDKAFLVVRRVVDVLVGQAAAAAGAGPHLAGDAAAMAVALYREGRRTFGDERWRAFLEASNDLMRAKDRWDVRSSVDSFFRMVDVLRPAGAPGVPGPVHEIMELLRQGRPQADSFRARLLRDPGMIPSLDPLIPAIVQAVVYWGEGAGPVAIVHDQQTTLTEARVARLRRLLGRHPRLGRDPPGGWLAGFRLVDSRSDPRVQVADFLAGVARKIASDELNGSGDAELTALLRPYVDRSSVWGDDRSWSALEPLSGARS